MPGIGIEHNMMLAERSPRGVLGFASAFALGAAGN